MNLIAQLLKEAWKISAAYAAKDAKELVTHLCHVVIAVTEATPMSVDDVLAAGCKLALANEQVMDYLADQVGQFLFRDEELPTVIVGSSAEAGLSANMVKAIVRTLQPLQEIHGAPDIPAPHDDEWSTSLSDTEALGGDE